MSRDDVLAKSRAIARFFCDLAEYKSSVTLALYSPIKNEVETEEIFKCARKEGKRVVYPKIIGEGLSFFEVRKLDELVPGRFGILEPESEIELPVEWIDLFVIPGVGFDTQGYRLGFGSGYYDQIVCKIKGHVIGVAYAFQVIDDIFHTDRDIRVEKIVTDEGVIDCLKSEKKMMEVKS